MKHFLTNCAVYYTKNFHVEPYMHCIQIADHTTAESVGIQ